MLAVGESSHQGTGQLHAGLPLVLGYPATASRIYYQEAAHLQNKVNPIPSLASLALCNSTLNWWCFRKTRPWLKVGYTGKLLSAQASVSPSVNEENDTHLMELS